MIKLTNTLTSKKESFEPINGKKVNMFVCGPTVYDYIHIGNARTFVFFDVVAKYLRHRGYDVNYIQNITDIDNKIIDRAQKEGVDPLEYAKKYSDIFKEDMKTLGVTSPEYKNATDHIPEVIKQVQTLLDKNNAYIIEGDGIYFDLSTFPDYGKLSGRTAGMADDAVSRIDDSDKKRNRGDFAIWKFSQEGDPSWNFETGKYLGINNSRPAFAKATAGRPGWHIEDTAITEKYFGPQYDLHGGGQDLIFPHHEAEIAQQESASGLAPFVKYWLHVAFLINKDEKMSKSKGNFKTVHELLEKYPKEVLRFYLLSGHYRSPLEFSDKTLRQSEAGVSRIYEFVQKLNLTGENGADNAEKQIEKGRQTFLEAMDDNFNFPKALAAIFDLIRDTNNALVNNSLNKTSIEKMRDFLKETDSVLGIIPTKKEKIPDEILELVEKRENYRKSQKWEEADKIRAQIEEMGYKVEDTIYGPLMERT
ncbi:MAG: cysteine--tRNA ligase [Candidatus Yanofskybacteria bacterium RIFCSPHIGHO2_01_FULL_42_12]|uniref:Cysteine--tRNA ligase n=1 Tax=Candidatus Yanofskybacteria bacterium RIFCSPLOWO2_01_FULL_42_49 TaxID=1802694 RepID=A0A1F8GCL9_9BACT|nr:MAG: cysteine--tRNA ligase [Candidatus Yanofskybacteria bacterium RIFCSPHIGHO2_01_FULL_42_12]OGN22488.1 MAG: cysteine--tRNA ligase [Candidatus Yanofskybacteria bacterium RIFCSPLOWO2_01_FULL_42_49]